LAQYSEDKCDTDVYGEAVLALLVQPDGKIPIAADFDGDGISDVAVSHNRQWYAWLSSMGYVQTGPYDFNLQE